jgi:branched-chain amino acid transport system ATP-binding protein
MSSTILNVVGLTSGYGATVVLRDVSLALREGEILAVLGKNGMGKSTLLKTIMGFLRPVSGSVELGGRGNITGQPPHLIARAGVAYAPQEYTIFQELTVEENLRLALADDSGFRARLDTFGELFPRMIERLGQRAGTLSGGEQKMLIMSRALLARPRVMLIDEISEGLQPTMIERMAEALRRARAEQGVSILIVEQHLRFALSVADRYAVLKLGEVIEEGRAGDPAAAARLADHMKV